MSTPTVPPVDQNVDPATVAVNAQVPQKRVRVQLSCTSCRNAKLKCDRGHPCSQCTKRNRSTLCAYATAPVRQRPSKSMQSRLNHLESMVIGMMNDQPLVSESSPSGSVPFSSSGTPFMQETQAFNGQDLPFHPRASQDENVSEQTSWTAETASGQVVLAMNETAYVGATHWAAILEDIEVVKGYFNEAPHEDLGPGSEEPTAAMALGNAIPVRRADLLAALPERSVVDRLVSRYFNSNDPAMSEVSSYYPSRIKSNYTAVIIHKPTFQKEYQEFWVDPSSKPVMWIGLLYAILCLATFYSLRAGDELLHSQEHSVEYANKFRTLCAQSMVLGNYFKPGLYTMEALLLHFESEFTQPGDSVAKCWVLHGMAVRLALRMGYHRDAKRHINISPFHGEMRRRVWHLLAQVDLILSFQVGLPSMIQAIQSDTTPPHNLLDDDFSQASPELPPARPESEATPISYMICKARICHAFGMIVEQANSILSPTYIEVLNLDGRLREAYNLIPPFLLIRPLDQSITDNPNLIMQRFNIILLFHKSRCVLHRKYLAKGDLQDQNSYSRDSCIDSALELLHYQSVINDAIQPGGQLSRDRWFLTTIAAHDFLLGAMIIYLALMRDNDAKIDTTRAGKELHSQGNQEMRMLKPLQLSYDIWRSPLSHARDARKASGVLKIMLRNAKRRVFPGHDGILDSPGEPAHSAEVDRFPVTNSDGSTFSGYSQVGSAPPRQPEDLGTMIDMLDTIDWESWDSYINAPDTEDPEQL